MAFHVFLFLLAFLLLLGLVLLWRLSWAHLQRSHSPAESRHALVHRLLKPRSPDDCPVCRLASPGVKPASEPVRPWSEMKSRRGAPKRILTEGYACPNQQCAYFGAERIQTFRCQACRTTFSAQRHTPLYRLKTPSHQIGMVLSALAEGLDASAAERVFGYRQATISTWLTRAGQHAQSFHEHMFCHLRLAYVQLDELRTRLRSHTHVLWLWLAIDPTTKIMPAEALRCSLTSGRGSQSGLSKDKHPARNAFTGG
jgi:hypothetical protein